MTFASRLRYLSSTAASRFRIASFVIYLESHSQDRIVVCCVSRRGLCLLYSLPVIAGPHKLQHGIQKTP